jgi:hypothetical protein
MPGVAPFLKKALDQQDHGEFFPPFQQAYEWMKKKLRV